MKQLKQAINIKRNLGMKAAKGYMRNRNWPLLARIYVAVI